ncbi:E3 ubiquitin-protein ligase UPL5-like [Papaver somniferum]|uniref:E3 ubiquitin-protein ligase UPL5-like n=1 Tax=Papaver somniferum TaxID=3469 RepID=UPI000E6F9F33|nr:E3 ubiquitin-protein ligase UPL5-like [Papaver somniferum]
MVGVSLWNNMCKCLKIKRDDASLDDETSSRFLNSNTQSVPSCSTRYVGSSSSSKSLHFFVRNSDGNTQVIHANADDTVESVHEQIRNKTGIPVFEQGYLVYGRKNLEMDKTLGYYSIQRDAQLQLVARMRSTQYPDTWKAVDRLILTIGSLCRDEQHRDGAHATIVINSVKHFIDMSLRFKTRNDDDAYVSHHIQIFVCAGAAAALVMLFLSPIRDNKECAEKAIQLFLNPLVDDEVKIELRTHFVPIILEFCILLCSETSTENPLYISCRNEVRKTLETIHVDRSRCFNYAQGRVVIQGFVSELGRKVIKGLEYSPQTAAMSFLGDVSDFVAFSSPMCNAIEDGLGGMDHLPLCLTDLHPCYVMELGTLHLIFLEMLGKIDERLKKMEISVGRSRGEMDDSLRSGWGGQYLSILKALNILSEIYEGAEEKVQSVLRSRQAGLDALVTNSSRNDDHLWILEHKDLISFECRRHLAMTLLPELKEDYTRLFEMLIDRDQLLAESFKYVSKADVKDLVGGRLFPEFKNEKATGHGVLREWFCLVCQAICNPRNGLFLACADDNRRFFPNPAASDANPLHLEYFRFGGGVFALSLVYNVQVGILFDRTFFLQLAGEAVSLEDARDADPLFYSSCKKILEMDTYLINSDALSLTFVTEVEKLGSRKPVELCAGGNSIAVNSKNREAYVNLLIQHRFVKSVTDQVKAFSRGFSEILCDASLLAFFFRSLEHEDLDRMLHGSDRALSVEDWKAHTKYNGYKSTDSQIIWFWKVVEVMSAEQRRVLLFFWTSVKYLPVEETYTALLFKVHIYRKEALTNTTMKQMTPLK